MAKVTVPIAKIAEMLGLPADTDEQTVMRAMNEALAREDASQRAAADEQFRAADERTVAAAISAGKIGPGRKQHWLDAQAVKARKDKPSRLSGTASHTRPNGRRPMIKAARLSPGPTNPRACERGAVGHRPPADGRETTRAPGAAAGVKQTGGSWEWIPKTLQHNRCDHG